MAKKAPIKKPVTKPVTKPKPKPKPRPKKKDDDCFITTACVNHFGLDDNCYELEILRGFRDVYLLGNDQRKGLVKQYYIIAPTIVKLLDKAPDKNEQYKNIYKSILKACKYIKTNRPVEAQRIYTEVVKNLCIKFDLI
jgi:hypothetical protein